MLQVLSDSQQIRGAVTPVDKKGNPAPVQNSVFSSTDENVITVGTDDQDPTNPLKFLAKAVAPGVASIKWDADADMGDGVVPISSSGDIQVTGGQAVGATMSFGTPEEQA